MNRCLVAAWVSFLSFQGLVAGAAPPEPAEIDLERPLAVGPGWSAWRGTLARDSATRVIMANRGDVRVLELRDATGARRRLIEQPGQMPVAMVARTGICLLYTSDAADE